MLGGGTVGIHEQRDRHVTKPAVNNADGQCCELRWYQTHKRFYVCRGTRPAAQRDRSHSVVGCDGGRCGPTALSRRMLFFSVIGAFSDGDSCDLVPAETPLCRNKVTLLLVTLRSGTLTRAFLRYLRRCRDAGLSSRELSWDIKDIMVIDARGMYDRPAS